LSIASFLLPFVSFAANGFAFKLKLKMVPMITNKNIISANNPIMSLIPADATKKAACGGLFCEPEGTEFKPIIREFIENQLAEKYYRPILSFCLI